MKLTKELLQKIIKEEKQKILASRKKKVISEAIMVPLTPIQNLKRKEESLEERWMRIAGIDTGKLNEGEVVDMFSTDQKKDQAVEQLARAMAARAEEMLDADGDGDDITVHVDHKLFLSPYIDFDGHKGEVPALADHVYNSYILEKSGDQSHSLEDIIERIGIDYFDEDIEYVLEASGDDRWTVPHTWNDEDEDQMMKTKEMARQRDPEDEYEDDVDFANFLDSIGDGSVVEFPED